MNSTLIPHYEILENVKDDSGITNIAPYLEKIRRWIFRAEQDLGYNGTQVFKRIKFQKDTLNWNGRTLNLPSDCLQLNNIYIDKTRINNQDYRQYGNHVTFQVDHADKSEIEVFYYGVMHDAEGNTCVPRHHNEAIISYILWKIFGAQAYLSPNRKSRNLVKSYEQDWRDNRDAAHGTEAFPMNEEDYEIFSTIRNFSTKDAMIYFPYGEYENETIMESKEDCVLKKEEQTINVYTWQFPDTLTNSTFAPNVSQEYLDEEATKHDFLTFKQGVIVPYNAIGRIAFAVQGGTEKQYGIYDTFNSNVTSLVFEQYYNPILKLDIYISKEFYSHSNIFFKIKEL